MVTTDHTGEFHLRVYRVEGKILIFKGRGFIK